MLQISDMSTSRIRSLPTHEHARQDAAGQSGVISRQQLLLRGFSDETSRAQLKAQRWSRLLPGVYLTNNGNPTIQAWWWAAHLYAGHASAIAGDSALQLWGVRTASLPVTVEIPHEQQIAVSPTVAPDLVVWRRRTQRPARSLTGLPPAVKLADTVIDLSEQLASRRAIGDLVTSACRSAHASPARIRTALSLRPTVINRAHLEGVLLEIEGGADSVLEIDGVQLVLRPHGLPEGEGQVRSSNRGAAIFHDRLIQEYALVLEFDGALGHDGYSDRIRDHRRDNAVAAAGGQTLRFDWSAVHDTPCETAAIIARVLRQRGWAGIALECGPRCRVNRS